MNEILQRITVEYGFPVVFTDHLFDPANPVLAGMLDRFKESRVHRAMVFVDGGVAASQPDLAERVAGYFRAHAGLIALVGTPHVVPGGEAIKNDLDAVLALAAAMLDERMDRHSFVLAIGGGAVLDAVGFAAALVHRGLRIVRVPTTVLSQDDGGVGVKNGVNFAGQKNALGTFTPPFAVLNDFQFLRTLPERGWLDGVAEAFKVAIIRDAAFFGWLCEHAARLRERDEAAMREVVQRCARLHLEHIRTSGDPFETGRARPLDFGHWAAHKLETASGFRISHGEAVAAGLALDCWYAVEQGWLEAHDCERVHRGLVESGFRLWFDELGRPEIFDGLREFQEHLGGELCITFPLGMGASHEVHAIALPAMQRAIEKLRASAD